jgi:site-specific DNA-cytosine methylase
VTAVLAERELVFPVAHLACGSGFGPLGFARGRAVHGRVRARFHTLFGVDVDPLACRDFERIVGAPCFPLDLFTREQYTLFHGHAPPEGWTEATGETLRQCGSGVFPVVVFTSTPCKGASSLTSEEKAGTEASQQLNELLPRSVELAIDAWGDDPPALFILENVPRITARARAALDRARLLLELHGYVVAETVHDCGELGGLAQHRQRFLLVARHKRKIRPFLYEPDRRPVRGVGEVIGGLPMPDDPRGGPMHRLPRLQWKTWLRLALIEAGSDWRSLNKLDVVDGQVRGLRLVPEVDWHAGVLGVRRWEDPSVTITGESLPCNGAFSVADPRSPRKLGSYQPYGVVPWSEPSGAVTCQAAPGAGPFTVADVSTSKCAPYNDVWRVVRWDEGAHAVTTGGTPSAGGQSVADPRVGCKAEDGAFGSARHYGVLRWDESSPAVTGSASHDNGAHSVADPRNPKQKCCPWIWSPDGTRHRPFTTLELAALQGYPLDRILELELGGSDSVRREHIGNGVPVPTAAAIASTMLHTLLLQAAGQSFVLSAAPIWVNPQIALALAVEGP